MSRPVAPFSCLRVRFGGLKFSLLSFVLCAALFVGGFAAPPQTGLAPLALHPENPHYFSWDGRPTVLITSGEHYGAVINLDFDYRTYLDTLAADGLNYTRIFSGAYVEPQGAFKIERNTLAPSDGRFISPWPRSAPSGDPSGRPRFDLSRWNDAYFDRLTSFIAEAARRRIVVELTLFCPMYEEVQWSLSPMNTANNINRIGTVARNEAYTLDRDLTLLTAQEALTRKLVTEVNAFPNVFFEIINEPYFGGVTMAWQHRIADLIVETERALPVKHLIAQNIANKTASIVAPHPAVSIFNFHYATPPDAIATNYALNTVIGDDETGFRGVDDEVYRTEGWEFIVAGGGLYNNLDYSFAVGYENGTFAYPATQPGGGSRALRRQLKILRDFIQGFDLPRMVPDSSLISGGVPSGGAARALVDRERAMAIYLLKRRPSSKGADVAASTDTAASAALRVNLSAGQWRAEWIAPITGAVVGTADVAGGGVREIVPPAYQTDIALRLRRQ